jgi:hypothetical protein
MGTSTSSSPLSWVLVVVAKMTSLGSPVRGTAVGAGLAAALAGAAGALDAAEPPTDAGADALGGVPAALDLAGVAAALDDGAACDCPQAARATASTSGKQRTAARGSARMWRVTPRSGASMSRSATNGITPWYMLSATPPGPRDGGAAAPTRFVDRRGGSKTWALLWLAAPASPLEPAWKRASEAAAAMAGSAQTGREAAA